MELDAQIILKPETLALLQGRKVLLTGATGFFGKWLLLALRKAQANVIALSRNPGAFAKGNPELLWPGLSFISGEAHNFVLPPGVKIDYVLHIARSGDPEKDSPERFEEAICDGMRHLLAQIDGKLSASGKILFASSGAVYGKQPEGVANISESHPCKPLSPYGKGKLEAERIGRSFQAPAIAARCFAFLGPYLPIDGVFAAGNFIRDALNGEDIVIKGDGKAVRSYLYAPEIAEWLLAMLTLSKNGETYNLGSPSPIDMAALAHLTLKLSGSKAKVKILGLSQTSGGGDFYVPDVSKAERELGLKVRVHLEDALKASLEWNAQALKR